MKYSKPFLSFSDQLDLALSRGMAISDREAAERLIRRIGYYRLSAYWHHWRQTDKPGVLRDDYHSAATFEDSVSLYTFDRQLRLILLDAIERIEVALRVAISNVAGKRSPFIHQSTLHLGDYASRVDTYSGLTPYALFTQRCQEAYERSAEDFVKHLKAKYEDGPAIWVHIETWDFGLLSNFYKLMQESDKIEVAMYFGIEQFSMFESWIASLNYVRNLCAHHSRLFRRTLVVRPGTRMMRSIPELNHVRNLNPQRSGKLYPVLAILVSLMREIASQADWSMRLKMLMSEFPHVPTASLADYGFPDEWELQSLWKSL